ncbi:MAG: EAL domain-containing protein [Colwellia sp.]|nr:EAL domain-containing protein [Colwellia sp.]
MAGMISLKNQLSIKLARSSVYVALLIGLLLSSLQVVVDYHDQEILIDQTIEHILVAARPPAVRAVNTLDKKLAREVVDGLLKYNFIEQVSIEDELSEQLALATAPFRPSKTQWLTGSFTSATKTYQILLKYIDNPAFKPGVMTLKINMDSALAPFYDRSLMVFISGLARSFFLSCLLFILFYFVLAKPLKKLALQFSAIKIGGDTKLSVPEFHKNSELGLLANAANGFVNKVELLVLDQVEAEAALTQSKQRLLKLIDQIPQLILAQDSDGKILFANNGCSLFYQRSNKDLQGKTLSDIHHYCREEIIDLDKIRHLVLQQNKTAHEQEISLTSIKGETNTFAIQISPFDDYNQPATLLVASNISEQKKIQKHIEQLASHDALTGLPNRLLFNDRLEHAMANSQRDGQLNAILFLDLDHFKNINDSLGHFEGDKLLVHVAKVLESTVRKNDTVARMGGDEFVILLENLTKDPIEAQRATQDITDKILDLFLEPMCVDEHLHHIGASIGIVIFPTNGESVADLMRYADTAMYQAKGNGRKQAVFYEASMSALVEYRQNMESQLYQALREQQFVVHFQPQVDKFGTIYGFEALIRWQHPERGLVSPNEFIPILESSGLIIPVSDWLIDYCCQQILDWQQSYFWQESWHIAINISPLQFYQKQFVDTLAEKISTTRLTGSCICIEITETVAIKNVTFTAARLAEIKALGISVALDDFGTGYSSLSYLKDLPIDILKIDRSFINDLGHKNKDKSIVEAIIAMAKVLEITVICEGVETELQVNIASNCGSEYFQGYYYCRPMSAASLVSNYNKKLA